MEILSTIRHPPLPPATFARELGVGKKRSQMLISGSSSLVFFSLLKNATERVPGFGRLIVAWIPLGQTLEHGARLIVSVLVPQQSCPFVQGHRRHGAAGITISDFFPGTDGILDPPLSFVERRQETERFRSQRTHGKLGGKLLHERLGFCCIAFLGQQPNFLKIFSVVIEREAG